MKNCLRLFSIFLSVFVLLSSCTNLLDDDKSASGQISMNFPARNVRTAENSEVLYYKFIITNRDTQVKKEITGPASNTIKIDLEAGFYNITVQIFHSSTPEQIFYEGQAKDVEVFLGKTNNLNIKLKRLKQNWVIDLTPVIDFTILDENPWGTSGITDYLSDSFNITDLFNGILPKAEDTINFIWKGKCSKSLRKLHIILAGDNGFLPSESYEVDFTSQIDDDFRSKVEDGKVLPVMHLYQTYDDERQTGEWLTEIRGSEVEFTD